MLSTRSCVMSMRVAVQRSKCRENRPGDQYQRETSQKKCGHRQFNGSEHAGHGAADGKTLERRGLESLSQETADAAVAHLFGLQPQRSGEQPAFQPAAKADGKGALQTRGQDLEWNKC